jgi:hypothetical protein
MGFARLHCRDLHLECVRIAEGKDRQSSPVKRVCTKKATVKDTESVFHPLVLLDLFVFSLDVPRQSLGLRDVKRRQQEE